MRKRKKRHNNSAASTTVSLTLDALVAEALEKNPELKFYEAEILPPRPDANRRTFANPEVSGGVGQKRVTGSGCPPKASRGRRPLSQPFEWVRGGSDCSRPSPTATLNWRSYARFKIALAARVRTLDYGPFAAQEKAAAAEAKSPNV